MNLISQKLPSMLLVELVNEAIDCLFHFRRGFSRHHPLILEHFQSTNTTGLVHHGTPSIDDIIDNVEGTGDLESLYDLWSTVEGHE